MFHYVYRNYFYAIWVEKPKALTILRRDEIY